MAIGQSRLHSIFRKGKVLKESVAWFEAFTPTNKTEILNLIREDQLRDKGIDGTGDIIGTYSFFTSLNNPEKAFNTPYTLYNEGKFYESMFIQVLSESFTVNADGQKEEDNLFEKYGDEIIQFTDENLDKIKGIIRRAYIDYVKRILFST
jgi:hypothetical protein